METNVTGETKHKKTRRSKKKSSSRRINSNDGIVSFSTETENVEQSVNSSCRQTEHIENVKCTYADAVTDASSSSSNVCNLDSEQKNAKEKSVGPVCEDKMITEDVNKELLICEDDSKIPNNSSRRSKHNKKSKKPKNVETEEIVQIEQPSKNENNDARMDKKPEKSKSLSAIKEDKRPRVQCSDHTNAIKEDKTRVQCSNHTNNNSERGGGPSGKQKKKPKFVPLVLRANSNTRQTDDRDFCSRTGERRQNDNKDGYWRSNRGGYTGSDEYDQQRREHEGLSNNTGYHYDERGRGRNNDEPWRYQGRNNDQLWRNQRGQTGNRGSNRANRGRQSDNRGRNRNDRGGYEGGGQYSRKQQPSDYQGWCSRTEYDGLLFVQLEGDLFDAPDEFSLAHCVAEDFRMGAGIAVEFKKRFKHVEELYNQCKTSGQVAVLEKAGRFIYYLVTKRSSSGKPTLQSLQSSIGHMYAHCKQHHVQKLAIPMIGCGLDRLCWEDVRELLISTFKGSKMEIRVYKPNRKKHRGDDPRNTKSGDECEQAKTL